MKKKNVFLLGLLMILLAMGLVLVGCGDKCTENGACKLRSDANANVLEARSCFMSDCNTTKQSGNEPGPNISVSCNCK